MTGGLDDALQEADATATLLSRCDEPYAQTAFLNQYANALAAAGRYEQALAAADLGLTLAAEYDFDFVRRFVLPHRARALTGLRRFAEARQSLREIQRRFDAAPDAYLECQFATYSAGLLLSEGALERASDVLTGPVDKRAGASIAAEKYGMHALVLSAMNAVAEYETAAALARELSHVGLETRGLLIAAGLVRAAAKGDLELVGPAVDELLELGTHDALVLAWRSTTGVLEAVLADDRRRQAVVAILLAARDIDAGRKAGVHLPREVRPRGPLSPREHEVHELVAQGLTNEEIAKLLFISLSTTKVHVKHIFEKLGVRSRIEAARLWEND